MKGRVLFLTVGMLIALFVVQPASGQVPPPPPPPGGSSPTPTPTVPPPTVTPTPSPTSIPSAEALLAASDAAMLAKGSMHIYMNIAVTIKIGPQSVVAAGKAHGDMSVKTGALHLIEKVTSMDNTVKPAKKTSSTIEMLATKKKAATRTDKGPWKCSKVDSSTSAGGVVSQTGSGQFDNTISATNLGATTLNGVPAWHIRLTMNLSGVSTSSKPATADAYIAQADNTLMQESVSFSTSEKVKTSKNKTQTMKLTETYKIKFSKYGEPVSVKLPTACTKAVSTSIAGPKILRLAGLL